MILKFSIRFFGFFLFLLFAAACKADEVHWSSEDVASFSLWLNQQHRSPGELVGEVLAEKRSIVLSQENAMRADTINLVKALVPVFQDNGLHNMALFFVNDSGPFRVDPSLAYSEYDDFLSYLENFNLELEPSDSLLKWKGLRGRGQVSITALKYVLQSAISKGPVFIWLQKEDMPAYFRVMNSLNYEESEAPVPLFIAHHGPEDERWEGLLESVLTGLDIRLKTFAFYSETPPFPSFSARPELKSETMYIVTSSPYKEVQPMKKFISSSNSLEAIMYFQNLSIRKPLWLSSWLMNQFLKRQAKKYGRYIKKWIH